MKCLSLRIKILCRLAVISLCSMAVLLVVLYKYVSSTFQDELIKRGAFIAQTLAEESATPILTQKELPLALMLRDAVKSDKDLDYVFIVDGSGNLIAHTFGKTVPASLKNIRFARESRITQVRLNSHEVIDIAEPIIEGTLGTLHAGISGVSVDRELQRIFLLAAAIIVVLFITAAFLMWLTLEQTVIRPVKNLERMARTMRQGDLRSVADVVADDEIGQLALSFNQMAEHLSVVDLQKTEFIQELNETNRELTAMIQEREEAEKRLAESEEKLRLILDSAAEGIYGIDRNGQCTFCNSSCLKILGFENPEELIGRTMHAQIHHSHPDGTPYPDTDCHMYQAFRSGEQVHADRETFWKADGTVLPVECWSFPQIKDNEIIGAVVTFVDISQRLEAEEENRQLQEMLLQSQKMDAMGTLAGGIAHDFNNILAVVYGYTEIARLRCGDNKPLAENLDQIMIAANRARELVAQILAFSRKGEIHKQPLELTPLIKETLKLLRSSIPATIEIRHDLRTDAVALADPSQIHQVIMNLCTNAYHAMAEKGGTLGVSLTKADVLDKGRTLGVEIPSGQYAVIEVSDTGCGMDNETKLKIFEPYFTTREKGKGSGLGLAVAHGIIKGHGGKITVYSEPGVGSSFRVYLPLLTSGAAAEVAIEEESTEQGKGERILFVDDEQQIRDLVEQFLGEHGYVVDVCRNAAEALERLDRDPFAYDLVVTDMAMPAMSGKDLAVRIFTLRPGLPVILCTGYSELINGNSARGLGIRDYIQKPIAMSRLSARIRKVLDESGQH